jgi:hypothetical protein
MNNASRRRLGGPPLCLTEDWGKQKLFAGVHPAQVALDAAHKQFETVLQESNHDE